jgi:chemotaxis protein methyltransferase CheR/two-component system CheB/CheR fusion protein
VGVILSGMGSDGLLGLRAIKERAGLAVVQEPASAKADSMPRSAVDAGLADLVALPEKLPAGIMAYLQLVPRKTGSEPKLETEAQSALEQIVILLRDRSGNDFSLYKTNTLYRRIERRTALHQIARIAGYVRYLRANPQELDLRFKELLIGVTSFFRDSAVWEALRKDTLPAGTCEKNFSIASSPPAEQPMPTMGNAASERGLAVAAASVCWPAGLG